MAQRRHIVLDKSSRGSAITGPIDHRHRYGHNLHFYYIKLLETQSKQHFFYTLNVGGGKRVNLEKCPLSKLQQQCVQYLDPFERQAYEVVLQDGKFWYKQTGEVVDIVGENSRAKWIFVLSTSKVLYEGKKKKSRFQHSSFLADGVTIAAGRLVVENGTSSLEEDEEDPINSRHRRIGSLDMEGFDEETHEADQESERHRTEQTENCIKDNGEKPFTTAME
ncbi:PREDICTED: IQ domain-containing protein IQM2-like [Tarenaya hassleriana]|uniref:IQ domain-containing protein IQM2-like n=1 Tax=Tarenaya hassleriana TaxID=28532 RepID=UPI00053CAA29|nr:PREDICTED: IQ domain-containing protein IQM2-like [Tarenaya hassleriana]